MKSEFKFALLALAEAVACVGLVGCGGSGEEPADTSAQVQSVEEGTSVEAASADESGMKVAAAAATWTQVATEGKTFSVSGTKTVRFGLGSLNAWVTKNVTGSGTCSTAFFGTDPAPGRGKVCEVSSASTTAPAPAPAPSTGTWTTVANEYKFFNLTAAKTVRFGSGDKWVSTTVAAGKAYCGVTTFPSDPAPGSGKVCQISGSAAAPAPAPSPAPAPAPSTGSAALAWVAPTKNADGSNLSDLAGFRVYYGTSSGSYSKSITINSPYTTNYTISGLPAATYYIIVKAYDSSNNESAASPQVTKSIK
jgi:hypothetical protein